MNLAAAGIEGILTRAVVFMLVVLTVELSLAIVIFLLSWKKFWPALKTLQPVHVDGLLYIQIAVYGSILTWITTDEAYKYCNAYLIFYVKGVMGAALAGTGALKMFRSNSYSDSLKKTVDNAPRTEQARNP